MKQPERDNILAQLLRHAEAQTGQGRAFAEWQTTMDAHIGELELQLRTALEYGEAQGRMAEGERAQHERDRAAWKADVARREADRLRLLAEFAVLYASKQGDSR